MKKIFTLFIAFTLLLLNGVANAQCPTGRFLNEIFSNVTLDSAVYSTPYNLMLDVYQPTGDTMSKRPLIIWAHEGSFVGGSRSTDSTVVRECVNFARRGYVTASIDYRLGNPLSMVLDSNYAISVVAKAISDGKAAIRYFVKDAATTNTYKIDTNKIYIGGNSAGAVLYMHVAYIDSVGACPPLLRDTIIANGGFEGNSGNAGYSTKFQAVVNYAGGLNTPSFVSPGGTPSSNAQGTLDSVVPYYCADAINGYVQVTLCGLGNLEPAYVANHIDHVSYIFAGAGHVPWDTDTANFNSIDSQTTQFLFNFVCVGPAITEQIKNEASINIFPNPTDGILNIQSPETLQSITIIDPVGRTIIDFKDINSKAYQLNTSDLGKGLYLIKINFEDSSMTPVIKRILVE